jgi:hypothetical protein
MSADLVLSGAEQQIPFDPVQTSRTNGFTVNPSGSFTLTDDGYYKGDMSIYVDKSGGNIFVSIWIERKQPLGSWGLASTGMSYRKITSDNGVAVFMPGSIDGLAGDEFRIMIQQSGNGSGALKSISGVVTLGTITQYAASLSVYKVGPVTP